MKSKKQWKFGLTKACLILFALALGVSCSSVPVTRYQDEKPALVLENFLSGHTQAYAVFTNRSGAVEKRFECDIVGVWQAPNLTLTENFTYSDGSKSQRIWTIHKISSDHYEGTAADVVGKAQGQSSGNSFLWTYTLALKTDSSTYQVEFEDWMHLINDRIMINRSHMSKWGVHLGDVTLTFVKP